MGTVDLKHLLDENGEVDTILNDQFDDGYDAIVEDKATQTDIPVKRERKTSGFVTKIRTNNSFNPLKPRNAVQILSELSISKMQCNVFVESHEVYCELQINNVLYKSKGSTTAIMAHNDAAEKALRDLMMPKITGTAQYALDIGMEEETNDIISMNQIASFALHKLYEECTISAQNISHEINKQQQINPLVHSSSKFENIHPVSLLNKLHPTHKYFYEGRQSNKMFKCRIEVNNKQFFGEGFSKRSARRAAAIRALSDIRRVM